MQKVFAIGTCRIHEPLVLLRRLRMPATASWHRVHTPNQILQFVRHLRGEDIYDLNNVGLLSLLGHEACQAGDAAGVLERLNGFRKNFADAEILLLEVSTFREYTHSGFFVDPVVRAKHSWWSMSKRRLHPRDAANILAAIREAAGKPILWVCHVRPIDGDPAYEAARAEREPLAVTVQRIAERYRDMFFDPTVVLHELGQRVALKDDGADLAHFTEDGTAALARHYRHLLWPHED